MGVPSASSLVSRTCEQCGKTFEVPRWTLRAGERRGIKPGRFCSRRCYGDGILAKSKSTSYPSIAAPDHPLARADGKVYVHRMNLYDRIGEGPHPCHWCGEVVRWFKTNATRKGGLVVDHLDGNKRNHAPANLVPSCHGCNVWRVHPDALTGDEPTIEFQGARHRSKRVGECLTCGKPTFVLIAETRPNRGRFCSRECMYRRPR